MSSAHNQQGEIPQNDRAAEAPGDRVPTPAPRPRPRRSIGALDLLAPLFVAAIVLGLLTGGVLLNFL